MGGEEEKRDRRGGGGMCTLKHIDTSHRTCIFGSHSELILACTWFINFLYNQNHIPKTRGAIKEEEEDEEGILTSSYSTLEHESRNVDTRGMVFGLPHKSLLLTYTTFRFPFESSLI